MIFLPGGFVGDASAMLVGADSGCQDTNTPNNGDASEAATDVVAMRARRETEAFRKWFGCAAHPMMPTRWAPMPREPNKVDVKDCAWFETVRLSHQRSNLVKL